MYLETNILPMLKSKVLLHKNVSYTHTINNNK